MKIGCTQTDLSKGLRDQDIVPKSIHQAQFHFASPWQCTAYTNLTPKTAQTEKVNDVQLREDQMSPGKIGKTIFAYSKIFNLIF